MFFEFANIFVTFQSYVNKTFKLYFNIFCVIYLDDMFIYLETEKKHWKYVLIILRVLLKYKLYAKLFKYAFNYSEITFLNFVINKNDIKMKQLRIKAIVDWLISKCAKNILVFLSFVEFYKRFVKEFSQIIASLINLIKNTKKKKN